MVCMVSLLFSYVLPLACFTAAEKHETSAAEQMTQVSPYGDNRGIMLH